MASTQHIAAPISKNGQDITAVTRKGCRSVELDKNTQAPGRTNSRMKRTIV